MNTITLIAALLTGALGAFLATRRGKNPYLWFFWGFFFGILGALAIFFTSQRKKLSERPSIQPSVPKIQGPAEKFWYYVNTANEQVGPMSLAVLNATWVRGEISESTLVWHEDLSEWKRLGELTNSP